QQPRLDRSRRRSRRRRALDRQAAHRRLPRAPPRRRRALTSLLPTLELETGRPSTASVIWLHGLGADGHDFEPIVPELDLPDAPAVRFVFPHAPTQPVTINGGAVMRAWYDVYALEGVRREDAAGIRASQASVEELIAREKARGIPAARLVLAGFSQGGAIALHTGLRHPERLPGIMALSTYLPLASSLAAEASAANRGVPIFMAHGLYDPLIPIERAQMSRKLLESAGYRVEWHEYPMEHSVCAEEIADVSAWLQRALERRGVRAGHERQALAHPRGHAPAAPLAAGEPRFHRRVVADGIVEERELERPAALGRRQRRIVRGRGDGDRGRPHERRERLGDQPVAVQQACDEALHLRPRAQRLDANGEPVDGHRQQEVDGHARDHEAGCLRRDRAREERGRRSAVLVPGTPRAARVNGGDEGVAVGDVEGVGHASPCTIRSSNSSGRSTWRKWPAPSMVSTRQPAASSRRTSASDTYSDFPPRTTWTE